MSGTLEGREMQTWFNHRAQDHARVRVLVNPISSVSGECYSRTLKHLRSRSPVPVKLPSVSQHKKLDLYFNHYSLMEERFFNGWDELQYHRRLLCVIGVAECEMLDDMNDIETEMARIEKEHQGTLLDWRCIVYIQNSELEEAVGGGGKGRFHCVLLPDGDGSCFEGFLEDVASYLYLAIDSRRHECSEMKPEKIPLLTSPLDKKEMTEEEGKQARRRCQSRFNKHLGDLCLLLGQYEDAYKYYCTAVDQLRSSNDWLWMGAALEGQCTASINSSHPCRQENEGEHTEAVQSKGKRQLTLKRNSRKSPSRHKACELMSKDEIVSTFGKALMEYSKFRDASVIEIDCRLSCVRHLTIIKKVKEAADILQETVYVKLDLSGEEKVELFNVMAGLFHDLNYRRKSSFYYRLGAMHSMSFKMIRPDWNRAYSLLVKSLQELGINISDAKPITRGWPLVYDRLLHEITHVTKKLDKDQLALSHSLRHLESLYQHLTERDLKFLTTSIDVLVKMIPKDCVASSDSSILLPLTSIPTVRSLVPRNLPSQLQPFIVNNVKSDSVFIFSSLKKNKQKGQPIVCWVQNSTAEVVVEVSNPLPIDIRVENLSLLTEGVKFVSGPVSVSLQAKSEVNQFPLVGTPLESGELKIKGYIAKVFGVESYVNFSTNHIIRVTPPLPHLCFSLIYSHLMVGLDGLRQVKSTSPENSPQVSRRIQSKGKTSSHLGCLHIMDGQRLDVLIKMENKGVETVNNLDINMSIPEKECAGLVDWTMCDISKLLPLASDRSANITITVTAHYPDIARHIKQQTTTGVVLRDNTISSLTGDYDEIRSAEGKRKGSGSPFARAKRIFKRSVRTMSLPNQSPVTDRDFSDSEPSPKLRGKRKFFHMLASRQKDGSSSSDHSKSSETTPSPETTLCQSLVLDWADLPHPRSCVTELTFKYGFFQADESCESWFRESHCVIEFLVQPVVKLTGFNVHPSRRRQTMAKLSLEVQNVCMLPVEVSCSVDGSGFSAAWYTLAPLRQCSVSAHVNRHHLCDNSSGGSELDRWTSWLKQSVCIEWTAPGLSIKGSLPLPHLTLTNWHLQSLQPDPLQICCYYIDGDRKVTNEGDIDACQPVEIFTEFHNISVANVGPFSFELQAKSTTQVEHGGELGWIGPVNGKIRQLHPDEKYVHCSCIMFSEGGEYEIQVKCRPTTKCSEGPGRQPSFHAAVLQLTVSEPPD